MTPDTLEVLIHDKDLKAENWLNFPEYGFRQYFLWKNPATGASIALLEYDVGGGIPIKHSHASNQFMYCLEGEYAYTDSDIVLKPGAFYMNPKDHPHGPTVAVTKCRLVEIYDGPHYYEKPSFHTDDTIGGFLDGQQKG
ncbi:cupin domain-containing protein (plasmid) [Gemmobacter fulvus]|uniref:Cupin domain-containing protein n=1 Tax=Gemmobacter fulvus TaxID=2840474 RepID=A0A975S3H6_9RHOB|nr:cupin domain-containing protein [Gemmobacter fulvus]MBT9246221.1 cupin domain-containing protein [Gemmobacter fulvus]MDQ1850184.1 cupin domain-containing protein [Gemmobacter fulvus]QWK92421.1 cupin domain-containing protein [Gemmobacter fulvus]